MNNKSFLIKKMSNYQRLIKQRTKSIRVCDINNAILNNKKYLSIEFKVLNKLNDKFAIVTFIKNVNIINNLKIKMYLSNDIIDSKNIIFNVDKNTIIINSC